LQSVGHVSQDPIGMAMPQAVPGPAEPLTRLRGASIEPGSRTLPPLLCRLCKVQAPSSIGREALLKQPPEAPGTVTEPDHLRGVPDALAQRFEPQTPLERIALTEDGHPPALMQPGHDLAGPSGMAAQAGQHASCDLVPGRLALGVPSLWAQRNPHPLRAQEQGGRRSRSGQRLWEWDVLLGYGVQVRLEVRHGLMARGLHPTPHRAWADH